MRHKKSGRKLGRNPSHRKALLRNMAKALLINSRITTTEAKAKTLRGVVEPLITLALRDDLHARRQAYTVLGDHALVSRLFDDIAPLFKGIPGGYTRVVKLAIPRKGDAAPLAIIELTKNPAATDAASEKDEKKAAKPKKAAADKSAAAKPKAKKAAAEGEEAPKKPRAPRAKKEAAAE